MKKKRKKKITRPAIFVSPDGGETVYEQLQKAWDQYRSVWHLITGNN